MQKILVWDLPSRLGHWLLVGGFVVAWLTGDSEVWRYVHAVAGGVVTAVVAFRLTWGLVGTRHARFTDFVRGPKAALGYLMSILSGSPQHHAGHNPAGAFAVLALLVLGLLSGVSGWLVYQDQWGDWLEEVHEFGANLMLLVVFLHLAGVAVGSFTHHENLPRAMVTGMKLGHPEEAIRSSQPIIAVLMLTWIAYAAWWMAR